MTAAALRAMLAAEHVTHVPGVFDPASAALAVRAGNRAVHLSGEAIAATMLGRSDLGYTPATQIADRAAVLVPVLGGVPLLADADVGYDDPDHAVWTALAYERAGISGLRVDDGEDAGESVARITALVQQVPDVALIAQARGRELTETIERCRAYADAGADAVLPLGVHRAEDLERVRDVLPGVPLVVAPPEAGGRRPSDAELAALGVRLVLHPLTAVLAALRAASMVYYAIADEGDAERVDRMPLAVFAALAGQPTTSDAPPPRSARPSWSPPRPPSGPPPSAPPSSPVGGARTPVRRTGGVPAAAGPRAGGSPGVPGPRTGGFPGTRGRRPDGIDRIDT
jgi:methylisocitrate lyase